MPLEDLVSTSGETLVVHDVGTHNLGAGPDFFNAKITIGDQLWAGNVEIHVNAADWYSHHHEQDRNYDNVILHVVWNDDASVFRENGMEIPTLELKNWISQALLENYQKLFGNTSNKFINCEREIGHVDPFVTESWLERLYFERLEHKTARIEELLEASKNDWENVLFIMLLRNFGLKANRDAFMGLAQALDFSMVRKLREDTVALESVLFGISGLLENHDCIDSYYLELQETYGRLVNKFGLENHGVPTPTFFKLRPSNFPTIRLSQFAQLYVSHGDLFSRIINARDLSKIYALFNISTNPYWKDHYTFGKVSRKTTKRLTKPFIDLLVINTILPLKFCYDKYKGKQENNGILDIIGNIAKEDNGVVEKFESLGVKIGSAKDSQAILQLHSMYCKQNNCLKCAIGNNLLGRNR